MALLTLERYQKIVGDTITAIGDVADAIENATGLLEDELCRPLEESERTERMWPDTLGRLYPKATPIIAVPDGYRIDGNILLAAPLFASVPDFITGATFIDLAYTGGYVERTAHPDAPNRLPAYIERDLAYAAYRLLHPSAFARADIPAGATSVSLGDAAVGGIGGGRAGTGLGAPATIGLEWSHQTMRHKRRRA